MLNAYLTQVGELLQNPAATSALYASTDLTNYINRARFQIAGETECVRFYGTLTLAPGVRSYPFSAIVTGTGIQGVFNTRGVTINVGSTGQAWIKPKGFPWFQLYHLNNPVPPTYLPNIYSQYGQGTNGTLYFDPIPDQAYVANLDCVCEPAPLASDTDPEVIPYPYTEAVPYYAAYLAFMSSQRAADAARLWQEYQKFAGRARQISNGSVNPMQYPQNPNPVRSGQLGMNMGGGGNG